MTDVVVVLLIVLLVAKELASASDNPRAAPDQGDQRWAVPLMFAFVAIAASRVISVLG